MKRQIYFFETETVLKKIPEQKLGVDIFLRIEKEDKFGGDKFSRIAKKTHQICENYFMRKLISAKVNLLKAIHQLAKFDGHRPCGTRDTIHLQKLKISTF